MRLMLNLSLLSSNHHIGVPSDQKHEAVWSNFPSSNPWFVTQTTTPIGLLGAQFGAQGVPGSPAFGQTSGSVLMSEQQRGQVKGQSTG